MTRSPRLEHYQDGLVWQDKLSQTRIDKDKTKKSFKQALDRHTIAPSEFWSLVKAHPELVVHQKYETPIGKATSITNSQRSAIYLPAVPIAIRRKIARRFSILDPRFALNRSARKRGFQMAPFWEWIAAHPEIPIVWTEGGKKALCLLSQGEVAIATYGVNGGYLAAMSAAQNQSMSRLRTALLVRLRYEGKQVTIWNAPSDQGVLAVLKQVKEEINHRDAATLVAAPILNAVQFLALEQKETHSPTEARAIARFYLCQFYCIPPESLAIEQVLEDRDGRQRGEILNLEAQLFSTVAVDRSVKALERQVAWNQGLCPWDISGMALRRELRHKLELDQFFDVEREWVAEDLEAIAFKARENAVHIKKILNFTIPKGFQADGKPIMSDVQIVHQLLSQMGIKIAFRWSGSGKDKHRVYHLNEEHWRMLSAVIEQRQAERESVVKTEVEEGNGSPVDLIKKLKQTGDPIDNDQARSSRYPQEVEQWLTPETLIDVRLMWSAAEGDDDRQEALRGFIPRVVLERAIA